MRPDDQIYGRAATNDSQSSRMRWLPVRFARAPSSSGCPACSCWAATRDLALRACFFVWHRVSYPIPSRRPRFFAFSGNRSPWRGAVHASSALSSLITTSESFDARHVRERHQMNPTDVRSHVTNRSARTCGSAGSEHVPNPIDECDSWTEQQVAGGALRRGPDGRASVRTIAP